MDPSSQEPPSPLPGVTSSLLVSIKDDELEREGGGKESADAEDEGHKNDKASSVRALMGHASRRRNQESSKGAFHVVLGIDMSVCVQTRDGFFWPEVTIRPAC